MQALEKTIDSNNWVTIILVVLLFCIFLLKGINSKKLEAIVFSFFNKNYIEEELEKRPSFLNSFNLILVFFSTTVFSLLLYFFVISSLENSETGFYFYIKIFFITCIYFFIKWGLELLISTLFLIKNEISFFLVSKITYLFVISFTLFIAIIFFSYTSLGIEFLTYFTLGLFILRTVLHLTNNKNLILSKLFYFILYLCAFEIAPLFVLFKLML